VHVEDRFSKASAQIHAKVESKGNLSVAEFTQKRVASRHLLINLEYQVEFPLGGLIAESDKWGNSCSVLCYTEALSQQL